MKSTVLSDNVNKGMLLNIGAEFSLCDFIHIVSWVTHCQFFREPKLNLIIEVRTRIYYGMALLQFRCNGFSGLWIGNHQSILKYIVLVAWPSNFGFRITFKMGKGTRFKSLSIATYLDCTRSMPSSMNSTRIYMWFSCHTWKNYCLSGVKCWATSLVCWCRLLLRPLYTWVTKTTLRWSGH